MLRLKGDYKGNNFCPNKMKKKKNNNNNKDSHY